MNQIDIEELLDYRAEKAYVKRIRRESI